MFLWLYTHVSIVFFKCFRLILQVFHLDVAKVDMDAGYIAMATHMFQVFHMFQTYVVMFHLDVSKVDLMLHMLQ
jgi:hypothetical protein